MNAPWMRAVLILAGMYNLAWGACVIVFPSASLAWLRLDHSDNIPLWQCIGMIVGVYGLAYLGAARDPCRHWPVILAGLLGKILGPIGFVHAALQGSLPWSFGWINLTNDLIWWLPFSVILWRSWCYRRYRP